MKTNKPKQSSNKRMKYSSQFKEQAVRAIQPRRCSQSSRRSGYSSISALQQCVECYRFRKPVIITGKLASVPLSA
jgi:transposase-like protein